MPANVESMFYVRVAPWHGLGTRVEHALTSQEALTASGLDWNVVQRPIMTSTYEPILGFKANIRDTDQQILGVVSDKYKVVQNHEAFSFTDALLGEGVRYETAGSLNDGRKVWMLAKLPDKYTMMGEEIEPYLVFSNTHDGSGAIRVCLTPIRIVCQNTLNLALKRASRTWSLVHKGDLVKKMDEARYTLGIAHDYMGKLGTEFNELNKIKLSDPKVVEYIEMLLPMSDNPTEIQKNNITKIREDMMIRYFEAPDLRNVERTAYRFILAISDHATHSKPLRETVNYKENLFAKTIAGHPLIDKAHELVLAA